MWNFWLANQTGEKSIGMDTYFKYTIPAQRSPVDDPFLTRIFFIQPDHYRVIIDEQSRLSFFQELTFQC